MLICGVELTGSDAVVCLLKLDGGHFSLPECKVRKISLRKNHRREDLIQFQNELAGLVTDYGVNRIVIRERMQKGKFAGGAISFKLEAAMQLLPVQGLEVALLSPSAIKTTLAANPLPIAFPETGPALGV